MLESFKKVFFLDPFQRQPRSKWHTTVPLRKGMSNWLSPQMPHSWTESFNHGAMTRGGHTTYYEKWREKVCTRPLVHVRSHRFIWMNQTFAGTSKNFPFLLQFIREKLGAWKGDTKELAAVEDLDSNCKCNLSVSVMLCYVALLLFSTKIKHR